MAAKNTVTIEIPLSMPRLSKSEKVVLFGGLNGTVKTPYGEMKINANLMAPVSSAATADMIKTVARIPGLANGKAAKALKEQSAKEGLGLTLKALGDLPEA